MCVCRHPSDCPHLAGDSQGTLQLDLGTEVQLLLDGTPFAKGCVVTVNPTAKYHNQEIGMDSIVVNRVEMLTGAGTVDSSVTKAAAAATMWFAGPKWAAGVKFKSKAVQQALKDAGTTVRVPRACVRA
jgi:hypothetical protein